MSLLGAIQVLRPLTRAGLDSAQARRLVGADAKGESESCMPG